jgi:hypothetical protein
VDCERNKAKVNDPKRIGAVILRADGSAAKVPGLSTSSLSGGHLCVDCPKPVCDDEDKFPDYTKTCTWGTNPLVTALRARSLPPKPPVKVKWEKSVTDISRTGQGKYCKPCQVRWVLSFWGCAANGDCESVQRCLPTEALIQCGTNVVPYVNEGLGQCMDLASLGLPTSAEEFAADWSGCGGGSFNGNFAIGLPMQFPYVLSGGGDGSHVQTGYEQGASNVMRYPFRTVAAATAKFYTIACPVAVAECECEAGFTPVVPTACTEDSGVNSCRACSNALLTGPQGADIRHHNAVCSPSSRRRLGRSEGGLPDDNRAGVHAEAETTPLQLPCADGKLWWACSTYGADLVRAATARRKLVAASSSLWNSTDEPSQLPLSPTPIAAAAASEHTKSAPYAHLRPKLTQQRFPRRTSVEESSLDDYNDVDTLLARQHARIAMSDDDLLSPSLATRLRRAPSVISSAMQPHGRRLQATKEDALCFGDLTAGMLLFPPYEVTVFQVEFSTPIWYAPPLTLGGAVRFYAAFGVRLSGQLCMIAMKISIGLTPEISMNVAVDVFLQIVVIRGGVTLDVELMKFGLQPVGIVSLKTGFTAKTEIYFIMSGPNLCIKGYVAFPGMPHSYLSCTFMQGSRLPYCACRRQVLPWHPVRRLLVQP